jgi:hypothetical protein
MQLEGLKPTQKNLQRVTKQDSIIIVLRLRAALWGEITLDHRVLFCAA